MANTRDETIRQTTQAYLQTIDPDNLPDSDEITGEILDQCEQAIFQINATRQTKWKVLHNLIPSQIADIILHCHKVVLIDYAGGETGKDMSVLGIYQDVGENEGVYVTDENVLRSFFRKYDYSITKREEDEVIHILRLMAPRRTRCEDVDLIPVNNGIFNYKTKILEPFDPEHIFTAKSRVDYNPIATNVVIHNSDDNTDWDVESWMNELSDDPAVVKLLWQILGAIIRPNVAWDKSAWFYSEAGNNGKGTLCELMRQLCGKGTSVSIPLSDMGKDFMLEPLIHASAIIVDENDVGTFIDKAANLKALVTHDVIQVNRKFKTPVAFRFKGFMVQCLNEMPRVKDKSDSFSVDSFSSPLRNALPAKNANTSNMITCTGKKCWNMFCIEFCTWTITNWTCRQFVCRHWQNIVSSMTRFVSLRKRYYRNLDGIWFRSGFCTTCMLVGIKEIFRTQDIPITVGVSKKDC